MQAILPSRLVSSLASPRGRPASCGRRRSDGCRTHRTTVGPPPALPSPHTTPSASERLVATPHAPAPSSGPLAFGSSAHPLPATHSLCPPTRQLHRVEAGRVPPYDVVDGSARLEVGVGWVELGGKGMGRKCGKRVGDAEGMGLTDGAGGRDTVEGYVETNER